VEIAAVAVVVDARLGMRDRRFRGVERFEGLVHDLDEVEGGGRRLFRCRCNGRDGVADETDLLEAERVLVLGDGQDAEGNRQIPTREHRLDAVELFGGRDVDRDDFRVWVSAAQQFAEQHARKGEIVGEARGAGHFGDRVDLAERLPNDGMFDGWNVGRWFTFQPSNLPTFSGGHTTIPGWAARLPHASVPQPARPPRRS